jgi:hypothetical protein
MPIDVHGVGEPAHAGEGVGHVGVRLDVIRLDPHGLLIADDRRLELAAAGQGESQVVVGLGIVGS